MVETDEVVEALSLASSANGRCLSVAAPEGTFARLFLRAANLFASRCVALSPCFGNALDNSFVDSISLGYVLLLCCCNARMLSVGALVPFDAGRMGKSFLYAQELKDLAR